MELEAGNVRRSFRRGLAAAGLDPGEWKPRGLRRSFVSLLSAHGATVEQIADLVGHAGTTVTEAVYRHELRPVLPDGATMMDEIFPPDDSRRGGQDGR
jgi:integrase